MAAHINLLSRYLINLSTNDGEKMAAPTNLMSRSLTNLSARLLTNLPTC